MEFSAKLNFSVKFSPEMAISNISFSCSGESLNNSRCSFASDRFSILNTTVGKFLDLADQCRNSEPVEWSRIASSNDIALADANSNRSHTARPAEDLFLKTVFLVIRSLDAKISMPDGYKCADIFSDNILNTLSTCSEDYANIVHFIEEDSFVDVNRVELDEIFNAGLLSRFNGEFRGKRTETYQAFFIPLGKPNSTLGEELNEDAFDVWNHLKEYRRLSKPKNFYGVD